MDQTNMVLSPLLMDFPGYLMQKQIKLIFLLSGSRVFEIS
jgi:hypothetical protein